MSQMVPCLI